MDLQVLKLSDINIECLNCGNPQSNAFGSQSINVQYNTSNVIVQCSKSFVYKGLQISEYSKSYIDIYIDDKTNSGSKFIKFIQSVDDSIVKKAFNNSVAWFGKQLDEKTIDNIYKPTLRSDEYGVYMRVKLPCKDDKFIGEIFDKHKQLSSLDIIQPNCTVHCILECIGVYFVSREFGLTWKALQMKVSSAQVKKCLFIDDDDIQESALPI